MTGSPVRLVLQPQSTVLVWAGGPTLSVPVGAQALADGVLRHEPPTPLELEQAIERVEDALAGVSRPATPGTLLGTDARLRALPGLDAAGSSLSRDAVEALFQRLASRALGTPVGTTELPEGRAIAAALLVLRELMHHLGFERVRT